MTAPVEARSLSSLTTLFANPPQYPRNPTHTVREPLVLYIVRVPGSEDIFLTPLKPHSKASISAEAIQSSLYYFHVITPGDEAVKESFEDHRPSWGTEAGSRPDAIHRKPLPSSSSSSGDPSSSGLLQTVPYQNLRDHPSGSGGENHAPAEGHGENAKHRQLHPFDGTSTISRKPVGPRPIQSNFRTTDSAVPQRKPVRGSDLEESTRQRAWTEISPQIRSSELPGGRRLGGSSIDYSRFSGPQRTEPHAMTHDVSVDSSPAPPLPPRPSYSSFKHAREKHFHVTIIRRDPTSGSQWNVGSLSRELLPAFAEQDLLKIEITTPGYQKFARQVDFQTPTIKPFEQAVAENRGGSTLENQSITPENYCTTPKASTPNSTHFQPIPFTRDIITRPPSSHRPKSSHHHQRSSSSDSFPFSLSKPISPLSPSAQPHLTFSSPWQGTCTFTTGMDGHSLKCKHKLPAPSQPNQTDTSALVAELRFNLPRSTLRSKDQNSTGRRPNSFALPSEDAKHSFFKKGMARIRHELNSTSSDTDVRSTLSTSTHRPSSSFPPPSHQVQDKSDPESSTSSARLDLKLGRERAGGGRKGKSAKLGKLVLWDEGLKMADLVVAASVGVWWRVYGGWDGVR